MREDGVVVTKVLLIHAGNIPHYRLPIYERISQDLSQYGFDLIVISNGCDSGELQSWNFQHEKMRLSTLNIARFISKHEIEVVIDYMELRHSYLFPTYFLGKGLMGCKFVYWGQGCDLAATSSTIKNLAYRTELAMCDAIILYAAHLKKYLPQSFHKKVFVANNTLCLSYAGLPPGTGKANILDKYGIKTKKNIICVGRIQKRKRLEHLLEAFRYMNRGDIGLILVGPDPDAILKGFIADNIYKLGALYGNDKFDILTAADVYCLPGAVGLSIVDAFHCGLPFVTEDGDESAEIMYLRDGVNGFVTPKGHTHILAERLLKLIDNDDLREAFGSAARREIAENGNVSMMCKGFRDALNYVTGRSVVSSSRATEIMS